MNQVSSSSSQTKQLFFSESQSAVSALSQNQRNWCQISTCALYQLPISQVASTHLLPLVREAPSTQTSSSYSISRSLSPDEHGAEVPSKWILSHNGKKRWVSFQYGGVVVVLPDPRLRFSRNTPQYGIMMSLDPNQKPKLESNFIEGPENQIEFMKIDFNFGQFRKGEPLVSVDRDLIAFAPNTEKVLYIQKYAEYFRRRN